MKPTSIDNMIQSFIFANFGLCTVLVLLHREGQNPRFVEAIIIPISPAKAEYLPFIDSSARMGPTFFPANNI